MGMINEGAARHALPVCSAATGLRERRFDSAVMFAVHAIANGASVGCIRNIFVDTNGSLGKNSAVLPYSPWASLHDHIVSGDGDEPDAHRM
ncbi:MAG: hypothetical protein ABIO49_16005 [Dokdonella sp.]